MLVLEDTDDEIILKHVAKAIYGTKENDIVAMTEGDQANFNMSLTRGSVLKIFNNLKLENDDTILWIGYGDGFEATGLVLLAHKRGIKIKIIGYDILKHAKLLAVKRLARVKEQFGVDLTTRIDFHFQDILAVSPNKHRYTHVYTTAPVPHVCNHWAKLGLLGRCHKDEGTRQLIGFRDPHFNKRDARYLLKRKGLHGGIEEEVHTCQVSLSNSNEKRILVFAPLTNKVRKAISSAYDIKTYLLSSASGSNRENALEIDDDSDDDSDDDPDNNLEQSKGSNRENALEIDDDSDDDSDDDPDNDGDDDGFDYDDDDSDDDYDSDDDRYLKQITHKHIKKKKQQKRNKRIKA